MVQQTDVFSLCTGQRLIGIRCDSGIFRKMHITDPRIRCHALPGTLRLRCQKALFFQYFFYTPVLRGIRQNQFPVRVILCNNTRYHSVQIALRSTVQRYHNAECHGSIPCSVTLPFQFLFRTGHIKIAVCLCQSFPYRDPGFPQAVTLQIV